MMIVRVGKLGLRSPFSIGIGSSIPLVPPVSGGGFSSGFSSGFNV